MTKSGISREISVAEKFSINRVCVSWHFHEFDQVDLSSGSKVMKKRRVCTLFCPTLCEIAKMVSYKNSAYSASYLDIFGLGSALRSIFTLDHNNLTLSHPL